MSDAAIVRPARPWPPLIVADHTPRWVKWRDFVLTLVMWLLFAVMLETEFELFVGPHLERWGLGDFNTDANWEEFLGRLMPFVLISMMLIGLLVAASLMTLRRRRRGLLLPVPPPLEIAEQAKRAGMAPAALESARGLRIAVVHIEADGRHRVEPR